MTCSVSLAWLSDLIQTPSKCSYDFIGILNKVYMAGVSTLYTVCHSRKLLDSMLTYTYPCHLNPGFSSPMFC